MATKSSSKARPDINTLGELFEGLRDFADALPDDPGNAHYRLFLALVADRGDALLGIDINRRHHG